MAKSISCFMGIAGLAMIIAGGCKKHTSTEVPTLTTAGVTNLSFNTATSGGVITSNGAAVITVSGICWSSTDNPPNITTDSMTMGTTTSGSFSAVINNLKGSTTYYVRAYATNSAGTGYGNVVTFSTSVDTTIVTFMYNSQSVTYGVLTSTTTGRKWLDRNLGASRAATASNDSAAYGDLFQWGRLADGHQVRTSDTTSVLSTTDVPPNGKFILAENNPYDWRSPSNDNLWQGSTGTNNSCPAGWHVPTAAEWAAETGIVDSASAFGQLKLTVTSGYRYLDGTLHNIGNRGKYWTSTAVTASGNAYYQNVTPTSAYSSASLQRGNGLSVRCIKD